MNKSIVCKILICLFSFGLCLYFYIEKQNQLTSFKIEIPKVVKEINELKEEIKKMQFELEVFENPAYLMQLIKQPEFGYLKHPFVEDVLTMPQGIAFFDKKQKEFSAQ